VSPGDAYDEEGLAVVELLNKHRIAVLSEILIEPKR